MRSTARPGNALSPVWEGSESLSSEHSENHQHSLKAALHRMVFVGAAPLVVFLSPVFCELNFPALW